MYMYTHKHVKSALLHTYIIKNIFIAQWSSVLYSIRQHIHICQIDTCTYISTYLPTYIHIHIHE